MKLSRTQKTAILTLLGTSMALTGFSCDWLFGRRVRRVSEVSAAPAQVEQLASMPSTGMPPVVRDFLNT